MYLQLELCHILSYTHKHKFSLKSYERWSQIITNKRMYSVRTVSHFIITKSQVAWICNKLCAVGTHGTFRMHNYYSTYKDLKGTD
jgi:hypothetical protein